LGKMPPVDTRQRSGSGCQPKQRQRRLTRSEVAKLVATYREGDMTVEELAVEFGIHRQTAARHLDVAGATIRRKRLDETQITEAVRLYSKGWSLARIGDHFGCQLDKRELPTATSWHRATATFRETPSFSVTPVIMLGSGFLHD